MCGANDDVGDGGGDADLDAGVTLLSQLALEELVELGVEDTIGDELSAFADVDAAGALSSSHDCSVVSEGKWLCTNSSAQCRFSSASKLQVSRHAIPNATAQNYHLYHHLQCFLRWKDTHLLQSSSLSQP